MMMMIQKCGDFEDVKEGFEFVEPHCKISEARKPKPDTFILKH